VRAITPRSEDVAPAAPRVIGERYRVLAALGKGGAAQVYRVVDIANGRQLALKLLASNSPEKLRELFELEYQTLATFDHPHPVSVYEFGRDSNGTFYTMELLDGQDLGGRAPLAWRTACQYLSDASEALGLRSSRSR
jgi:serine/threonine protein kinase